MKFELIRPCNNCHFRRSEERVNLRASRAEEIAACVIRTNQTFACHKTTEWQDDGEGERVELSKSQHCSGALIFAEKHADDPMTSNHMLQIAQRLGLYNPQRLDPAAFAEVFDSIEEMTETHRKAGER